MNNITSSPTRRSLPSALPWLAVLAALFFALPLPAQVDNEKIEAARGELLSIASRLEGLSFHPKSAQKLALHKTRFENASDEELATIVEAVGPYLAELDDLLAEYDAVRDSLRGMGLAKSTSPDAFPEAPYPTGDRAATWSTFFSTGSLGSPSGGSTRDAIDILFAAICTDVSVEWDGDSWVPSGVSNGPRKDREEYQVRFTQKNAVLLAELIRDILGRICDQSIFILGAGGDLSLACIVSDLAYHAVRVFDEFPEICDALIDAAEIEGSYDRLGHMHDDLETAQSSIADVDSDLAAHDTALGDHDADILSQLGDNLTTITGTVDAARTTIINGVRTHDAKIKASLAAHDADMKRLLAEHDRTVQDVVLAARAFFLRTFIERALRRELGRGRSAPPSVNYRLAALYLPQAFGGQLEQVREVVDQTIARIEASGERSNGARASFTEGNRAFGAGAYKQAWNHYADAYHEALACHRSDPGCR